MAFIIQTVHVPQVHLLTPSFFSGIKSIPINYFSYVKSGNYNKRMFHVENIYMYVLYIFIHIPTIHTILLLVKNTIFKIGQYDHTRFSSPSVQKHTFTLAKYMLRVFPKIHNLFFYFIFLPHSTTYFQTK